MRRLIRCLVFTLAQLASSARMATAQRGDRDRPFKHTHPISTPIFPDFAAVTIAGRRDGWVEVTVRPTPSSGRRRPWLISGGRAEFHDAHGRGQFSPVEVRRAVAFAESLLTHAADSGSETRLSVRFHVAPRLLSADSRHSSRRLRVFDWWYWLPRTLSSREGPRTVMPIGVGPCHNEVHYGLAGYGAEETPLEDFRQMLASLRTAAEVASAYSAVPRPIAGDLLDALDTACEAAPEHFPVPSYPSGLTTSTSVHLDAVIDTTGMIEGPGVQVRAADAPPALVQEAVRALRQWRFVPALITPDRPVRQRVHVEFRSTPGGETLDGMLEDAARHGADILAVIGPAGTSGRVGVGR